MRAKIISLLNRALCLSIALSGISCTIAFRQKLMLSSVRCAPSATLHEGDLQTACSQTLQLWEGRRIPFVLAPDLPSPNRVLEAIQHFEFHTSLHFVPRQGETDYVLFRPAADSSRCTSALGRQGGEQSIELGAECTRGNVIHEIAHAIGLGHVHNRADRGKYVQVNWENIAPSERANFELPQSPQAFGMYDFGSILHYPLDAFSINGKPTLTPLIDPGTTPGQRAQLSLGDIGAIRELYEKVTQDGIAGSIDTSFGSSGTGQVPVDLGHYTTLYDLLQEKDGRTLVQAYGSESSTVSASLYLKRYAPDGIADPSFGTNGVVPLPQASARAIEIENGNWLVVGTQVVNGKPGLGVMRLFHNGNLDTSFYSGGFLHIPYDDQSVARLQYFVPYGVLRQQNGNLVVSGSLGVLLVTLEKTTAPSIKVLPFAQSAAFPYPEPRSTSLLVDDRIVASVLSANATGSSYAFQVARFNADGSPDTTFGDQGTLTLETHPSNEMFRLTAEENGRLLVVTGQSDYQKANPFSLQILRLAPDGSTESSRIYVTSSYINNFEITRQDDGKLIVVEYPQQTSSVDTQVQFQRFNRDFSLDDTFHNHGVLDLEHLPFDIGAISLATGGRALIAGVKTPTMANGYLGTITLMQVY